MVYRTKEVAALVPHPQQERFEAEPERQTVQPRRQLERELSLPGRRNSLHTPPNIGGVSF